MPQRVPHRHEIERAIGERQLISGPLNQRYAKFRTGHGKHCRANVDADNVARLSRNRENFTRHQSGSDGDVGDAQARSQACSDETLAPIPRARSEREDVIYPVVVGR